MTARAFYASSYNMGQHFGPESNVFYNQLVESLGGRFDLVRAGDAFKEYGKFKGFADWLVEPPAGEADPRYAAFVIPAESEILRHMLDEDDTRVLLEAFAKIHQYVEGEHRHLIVHNTTGQMVKLALSKGLKVKIAGPGWPEYYDIKEITESFYMTSRNRKLTTYCLHF